MHHFVDFLLRHGYSVVFAFVLAEQIGLPLPATPILLAMGALAGLGRLSFLAALALGVVASLIGDCLWYWLGRKRGYSVLNLLCRIALEPDSCVRQTENVFSRFGAGSLLFAKFVPGLSTAAPPLAGLFRMPLWRFLLATRPARRCGCGAFSGVGYIFRAQLEEVAEYALGFGRSLGMIAEPRCWRLHSVADLAAAAISPQASHRPHHARTICCANSTPVRR